MQLKHYFKGECGHWGELVAALSEMGSKERFVWCWEDMIEEALDHLFGMYSLIIYINSIFTMVLNLVSMDLSQSSRREAEHSTSLRQVAFVLGWILQKQTLRQRLACRNLIVKQTRK